MRQFDLDLALRVVLDDDEADLALALDLKMRLQNCLLYTSPSPRDS